MRKKGVLAIVCLTIAITICGCKGTKKENTTANTNVATSDVADSVEETFTPDQNETILGITKSKKMPLSRHTMKKLTKQR